MQIRMLASRFAAGGVLSYVAGSTYEVPNDLALQFIGDNAAVEVSGSRAVATGTQRDEFNRGAEGQAAVSLVSEAGNITAAELLTTTGVTGQTVRLSDGEDKGAILMWSTPEGATSETWCWWLWPQAAYL